MDPALFAGWFDSGSGGINVRMNAPGQTTNDRTADGLGDFPDGFKIPAAGNGEAGFDDIHPKARELSGHGQFLRLGHGRTGALLSIAESRVKNQQLISRRHVMTLAQKGNRRTCQGEAWKPPEGGNPSKPLVRL